MEVSVSSWRGTPSHHPFRTMGLSRSQKPSSDKGELETTLHGENKIYLGPTSNLTPAAAHRRTTSNHRLLVGGRGACLGRNWDRTGRRGQLILGSSGPIWFFNSDELMNWCIYKIQKSTNELMNWCISWWCIYNLHKITDRQLITIRWMEVSMKMGYPTMDGFCEGKSHRSKWMIGGYPYFRKPSNKVSYRNY